MYFYITSYVGHTHIPHFFQLCPLNAKPSLQRFTSSHLIKTYIVLFWQQAVDLNLQSFSINILLYQSLRHANKHIWLNESLNEHSPRTVDHVDCTGHKLYKFDCQHFLLFLQGLEWPRPLLPELLLNTSRMQNVPLQNASLRFVFKRLSQEKIVLAYI